MRPGGKDIPPKNNGPIRIDHLITDSGIGGAEKMLYELVKRLDPARYQCRVIVMKKPGAVAQMIADLGVPIISLGLPSSVGPLYPAALIPAAKRLMNILKDDPPRILHCWLFQANVLGRLAARARGVPINISSILVLEMERWIHYPLDRMSRGLVTHYVAVSKVVARHYQKKLNLPVDRISAILPGISRTPFLGCDPMEARNKFGISMQKMVIGTVCRLHWNKAVEVLIRALPTVVSVFPDLIVMVAGDGPERKKLERLVKETSLDNNVKFLGEFKELPQLLAVFDLFVLPSRTEGLPIILIEAMASGLPVVATDVAGVPELVVTGKINKPAPEETGILVPPGDHESLAHAIIELLGNQARRQAMGVAAGKRMEAEFTINKMLENYGALYDEL